MDLPAKRGASSRPGANSGRVSGLENIYMNKMPKLKPPMNLSTSHQK